MPGPLVGIKVLDLTRILAGPFATMRMGDMGASITKIELPGQGDDTRAFGPPFVEGESTYFLSINRNKKSLTLNLRSPEGKAILTKLIERSDVIIENFRPGTLDRLGFPYEKIQEINPKIIYCAISGYGHTGPRSTEPSYDLMVQGESGLMSITGVSDGQPTKVGISLADVTGGLAAVEGVLLALINRDRTGKGQKVDISLLDSLISLFTYQTQGYLTAGQIPQRMGNLHPTIAPYESFRTKDSYLNLGVANDGFWQSFLKVTSEAVRETHPDLLELLNTLGDEKFSSNASRVKHRNEIQSILNKLFTILTTEEWLSILGGAGIPAGKINSVNEILESDLVQARNMVPTIQHPKVGEMRMVGIPIKLSDCPGEVRLPPPLLGEHTDEILADLGYSEDYIKSIRSDGVI